MDPALPGFGGGHRRQPFTVTYKIRQAAWTDNAPIAADDFWYLWRQMVSQPVVDPAGYGLITGCSPSMAARPRWSPFRALPGVA